MGSVIVALPKLENANKVSGILKRNGIDVNVICTDSSTILTESHKLDNGVVVTGSRISGMSPVELYEYLPESFDMVVISPNEAEDYPREIIRLCNPFKASDLVNTLEMLLEQQHRRYKKKNHFPAAKSSEDKMLIDKAKRVLMNRNNMTEPEAYRYIQKSSMNTGTPLVETAQMILILNNDE